MLSEDAVISTEAKQLYRLAQRRDLQFARAGTLRTHRKLASLNPCFKENTMATLATPPIHHDTNLYVIHPLDDVHEQKCTSEGLGPMPLTTTVRLSLTALRVYLTAMTLIILYRTLTLAHVFTHHTH